MGTVYRARDPLIEREVAVKTLHASLPEEIIKEVRERFLREAKSAGRLNHPNIVTVFDVGDHEGVAYMAMELLEGQSLQSILRKERLSALQIANLVAQVADALEEAREFNIVHRDVKPANIMVNSAGRAKLTDFGVAYVPSSAMTQTGTALGSPKYMSPEQVLGQAVDPRSDIFSLGVVLYEMLTGKSPFEPEGESTIFSLMNRITNEPHVPVTAIDPMISPMFDRILERALAKKPENRYQRAGEMAADLRTFASGGELGAATAAESGDGAYERTVRIMSSEAMGNRTQAIPPPGGGDHDDIHSLLDERERLERMVEEKFRRQLTVMFTDLKGSTSMAETYGDLESRSVIKRYHDLAAEAIRSNNGVLVKTIGDGTLSHFPTASGALRASVAIQKSMDAFNLAGKFKMPILVRVGIHTGHCIVEKNDIFGDVVNAASRFESSAHPGEILISEETFQALDDKSEIYCRFRDEIVLKGKKDPVKSYKAFWDPREIEQDLKPTTPANSPAPPERTPKWKLAMMVVVPLAVVLAITGYIAARDKPGAAERRSIEQSVPQK